MRNTVICVKLTLRFSRVVKKDEKIAKWESLPCYVAW